MKKILLPFIILLYISSLAPAATPDNSKQPVTITSDTLEILQKNQQAIFYGNVKAIQGDVSIESDKMYVYYNMAKDKIGETKTSVSKVETIGNVFLATKKEKAKSDRGVFDVSKNIITLLGNVSLTSGKNVVKGEKFVYNVNTGKSSISAGNNNKNGTKKERVRGVFMPNG